MKRAIKRLVQIRNVLGVYLQVLMLISTRNFRMMAKTDYLQSPIHITANSHPVYIGSKLKTCFRSFC